MKKLENIFFVLAVIIFFFGALANSEKTIYLSLFVLVLMIATHFFGLLIQSLSDSGEQSSVFVETAPDLSSSSDEVGNENKVDNPWAQCVNVDYEKYLAMRDKCVADLRVLPNQDTPQKMRFGSSWTPRNLAQEITDQTTTGKRYVEMMVREAEDYYEENLNDT